MAPKPTVALLVLAPVKAVFQNLQMNIILLIWKQAHMKGLILFMQVCNWIDIWIYELNGINLLWQKLIWLVSVGAKNTLPLAMGFFFAIWTPSGNVYRLALSKLSDKHCARGYANGKQFPITHTKDTNFLQYLLFPRVNRYHTAHQVVSSKTKNEI